MGILSDTEVLSLIDKAKRNLTETHNIEFKDARGGLPTQIWRTISSFSHQPSGGYIVFGVEEDRENNSIKVVGGLNLAQLQEKLISFLEEKMVNHGKPDLRVLDYEGKSILVLYVDETPNELKPCYFSSLGHLKGACIREGNVDRVLTENEMRSFIRNSSAYKYDATAAPGTNLEMISYEKVSNFLEKQAQRTNRAYSSNSITPEIMKNIGIATTVNQSYVPTVAGFLIFSKEYPQSLSEFSRYIVRCVRYDGVSPSSSIIDTLDVNGTLDEQIDIIYSFTLRNIQKKATIVGTKRVEKYEYPEAAIRELIANAIIHRDYMVTGTYTQVNIFSNRIEITNPGTLPPSITIENLKDSQYSRNEKIASILKDLDYLEEYGRGIDIVYALMNEWGLMEPIFKNSSNSFKAVLLGEFFTSLNSRQIRIWQYIQDNKEVTTKKCNDAFPYVSRQTINNDINKLINTNLITAKGSGSNTYYESAY